MNFSPFFPQHRIVPPDVINNNSVLTHPLRVTEIEDVNGSIKEKKKGGGEDPKNCLLLLSKDASHGLPPLHLWQCELTTVTPPGETNLISYRISFCSLTANHSRLFLLPPGVIFFPLSVKVYTDTAHPQPQKLNNSVLT